MAKNNKEPLTNIEFSIWDTNTDNNQPASSQSKTSESFRKKSERKRDKIED